MTEKERIIQILMRAGFGLEGAAIAAEALLAAGALIPPCKVGDVVYCIIEAFKEPMEAKIYSITAQGGHLIMRCGVKGYYGVSYMAADFEKKFFLSREKAVAALAKLKEAEI